MNQPISVIRTTLPRLLREGERTILCGFSGGADSAALLVLLKRYAETLPTPLSITAAHVHHGIRGEEADRDAAFCAEFCRLRNIPLITAHVDVPAYAAAHRMGTEEAARLLRYRALQRIRTEKGIDLIATAHNATDQLETVWMHLIRGSGIDGLCGMRERNGDLIRPMLSLTKDRILDFCRAEGIPFVTDSSNDDQAYTRNLLRARLLPLLKELNPRAEQATLTMARHLEHDRDYLDSLSASRSVTEGRQAMASLPDPILVRVLKREFREAFPNAPMLTDLHLSAAVQAIRSKKSPIRITFPGGGELLCDHNALRIQSAAKPPITLEKTELCEGWQEVCGGEGMILARRGILTEDDRQKIAFFQNIYNLSNNIALNSDTMIRDVYLRAREAHDAYFDGGHTRNVRKLLQTLPLPAYLRAAYPIFCDSSGILWIPGFPPRSPLQAGADEGEKFQIFCFFGKNCRELPPDPTQIQGEKGT